MDFLSLNHKYANSNNGVFIGFNLENFSNSSLLIHTGLISSPSIPPPFPTLSSSLILAKYKNCLFTPEPKPA